MFKRKLFSISAAFCMLVSLAAVVVPPKAAALSGGEFRAGRIIDDSKFFDGSAMTAAEIHNFLVAKIPNCDIWGLQQHSSGQTRAQYASSRGISTPFICLKDFRSSTPAKSAEAGLCNGLTSSGDDGAAGIIYRVAKSCGISPKVLLVLLQKEQSLITDDWPWPIQYRSATGYGCPDTAPCDSEYYGFFNQVYMAARQFKRYARDSNSFNYRAGVNNFILYNPNSACGGSTVFIENQATAGLYNYTPYQPNASALNNLYGSGDSCGAYGNRNFWRMYIDWFGSTQGSGVILIKSLESNQLSSGATMDAGDYIVSPNGKFITTMQFDGNLVTYAGNKAVWHSGTSGGFGNYAKFQNDGNFVVYSSSNAPIWWSSTWDVGANNLALQDDGNIHIYANTTRKFTTNNKVNSYAQNNVGSQLAAQARLNPGDYLQSADGRYTLIMQSNGNLVLYSADGAQIWNSGTAGKSGNYALMQNDGNLVVYSDSNSPLWWTATWTNGASTLKLQNDGNLVVYRNSDNAFTWATWSYANNYQVNNYIGTQIASGTTLQPGDYLRSPDWRFTLVMQFDGNLVVYSADKYTPVWNARTWNNAGAYATLQNDGNFVVYDKNGSALWNTFKFTEGASVLKMQSDGNLVSYRNSNGWATWNSFGL